MHLLATTVAALPAASDLPTTTDGLPTWIKVTAIGAIVAFVIAIVGSIKGIQVMSKANKGTIAEAGAVGAKVLIGVGIIALCWGLGIIGVVTTTIGAIIVTQGS